MGLQDGEMEAMISGRFIFLAFHEFYFYEYEINRDYQLVSKTISKELDFLCLWEGRSQHLALLLNADTLHIFCKKIKSTLTVHVL